MTTLPNHAYHYYLDSSLPPLVVQVFYDYVFEAGEPHSRAVGTYRGKFVRLQEVQEPIIAPIVIRDDS